MQKYLNEGLEKDEVQDDVLGWWKVTTRKRPNKDEISDETRLISDEILTSATECGCRIFGHRWVPGNGILKFRRH